MAKRYSIWSIVTKGWVREGRHLSTYRTKREATAAIKACMVHEKDYEVRER